MGWATQNKENKHRQKEEKEEENSKKKTQTESKPSQANPIVDPITESIPNTAWHLWQIETHEGTPITAEYSLPLHSPQSTVYSLRSTDNRVLGAYTALTVAY